MTLLDVKNVSKNFGGLQALLDVSIHITQSQLIGLIGPNGAGKTTLVNVLDGVYKPNRGQVWLKGKRIDGLPPYQVARAGLGRTFQVTRAFRRMTVLENMLIPAFAMHPTSGKQTHSEKAMSILEFLTIEHLANDYGRSLSGGQQKLLELGRLLMLDPEVIILDEPFAGVHPKLQETIYAYIEKVRSEDKVIILISHDMESIFTLSERLIVLNFGQIIADGDSNEVKRDPLVIAAYLGKDDEAEEEVDARGQ
ncbi:MAG: ABC transporter ATP-binding protein [Anaerolineales bacterium]|nr:ABC transporter ATP-binding protein [Anaerolineales bacterium]